MHTVVVERKAPAFGPVSRFIASAGVVAEETEQQTYGMGLPADDAPPGPPKLIMVSDRNARCDAMRCDAMASM